MRKSHQKSVCSGILIVIFALVLVWGWTPANFSNPDCKFTQNAAWVSVDWTSQPVDKMAVKQLAESATSRNLRYLFPYISYLRSDGSFSLSYEYADEFVSTFRKFNKDVQILAWIGLDWLATR